METLRLDVWLDVACLFRTRSEAQKACKIGRVDVNGQTAKAHREVRPGDEIVISRPLGRKQTVVVRGLADRHVAKAEARALYEDRTPKPSRGRGRNARHRPGWPTPSRVPRSPPTSGSGGGSED